MRTKTIFLILSIALLSILTNCGTKKVAYFPTSEVTYQDYSGDILIVRVLGYGLNEADAMQDAQIRAIETLFFRGIPNSNINNPMIGSNELEIKQKNERFFNDFFKYKRFLTFITETNFISAQNSKVIATKIIKKKKTKQDLVNAIIVATDISINIKSLRKELEQQKIMKGFGY